MVGYFCVYLCVQVQCFKVNMEDVFRRWHKTMADLKEEVQALNIQREEVFHGPSKWSLYCDLSPSIAISVPGPYILVPVPVLIYCPSTWSLYCGSNTCIVVLVPFPVL